MKRTFCRSSQAAKAVKRRLESLNSLSLLVTAFMLRIVLPGHAAETTVFPGAKWAEAPPESQGAEGQGAEEVAADFDLDVRLVKKLVQGLAACLDRPVSR